MKGTPPTISEAMPPVVCWLSRCLLLIFISIQPPVGGLTFTEAPMAGGSVRGTVVDSVTGAAVARPRVSLMVTEGQAHSIETTTGADGRFEFLQVPAGECRLYVNK